jgi:hypothetical protein
MTGELQIDYEVLAQEAMRGIVRMVLSRVAALGYLPGEHHFYIAFDTRAPGVVVSKRLKQKYPEEMTIVLQHQFSDLTVDHERFEVTLSFGNVPERLTVPLRAVRVFFDPSVPYGLQLDGSDLVRDAAGEAERREADGGRGDALLGAPPVPAGGALGPAVPAGALAKVREPRKPRAAREEGRGELPASSEGEGATDLTGGGMRRQPARPKLVKSKPDEPANDAKVVHLDKFRKR